jgi:hypothetical protein
MRGEEEEEEEEEEEILYILYYYTYCTLCTPCGAVLFVIDTVLSTTHYSPRDVVLSLAIYASCTLPMLLLHCYCYTPPLSHHCTAMYPIPPHIPHRV